jgi:hypothetical protein
MALIFSVSPSANSWYIFLTTSVFFIVWQLQKG